MCCTRRAPSTQRCQIILQKMPKYYHPQFTDGDGRAQGHARSHCESWMEYPNSTVFWQLGKKNNIPLPVWSFRKLSGFGRIFSIFTPNRSGITWPIFFPLPFLKALTVRKRETAVGPIIQSGKWHASRQLAMLEMDGNSRLGEGRAHKDLLWETFHGNQCNVKGPWSGFMN